MAIALEEAERAARSDEVPVGAAILRGKDVVSCGHNLTRTTSDPTAHAEVVTIRRAAEALDHGWLEGCTLYVTLEPCAMCAGAMVNARLERVVWGADDAKAGACRSLYTIHADPRLNHRLEGVGGVLMDESVALLQGFFSNRRGR